LLESGGKHGRYVALSHCWGKSPRTVLTSKTLEDLKNPGIAISYLPKTFRDAVQITRKLRVRYLWIDSFCILQDSVIDWEEEATKMADVYRNSYITISASDSKDSFAGCFPSREATYIPPDLLSSGIITERDPSKPVTIKYTDKKPPHPVVAELHFFPEWMPPCTANAKKIVSNRHLWQIIRSTLYGASQYSCLDLTRKALIPAYHPLCSRSDVLGM
jgi:Heterokaryon incompatibility protein (HET)